MALSKSKLVNQARQKDTTTANGALTNSTSLNSLIDLFFIAGASRNMTEGDILGMRTAAYVQDATLAMRLLFRARDVRGGAGERRFFRTIWNSLDEEQKNSYAKYVPEYGRWDDLFTPLTYGQLNYISKTLLDGYTKKEIHPQLGLLCKWLPRKGNTAEMIRRSVSLSPSAYRHFIVQNSDTVEQVMSRREFGAIEYKKIPSQAFHKYKKAFMRNDETRFTEFITKDPTEIKAGTLFPYQLYRSFEEREDKKVIDAQWENLPDYVPEGKQFLPMVDVSGSMTTMYGRNTKLKPIDISVSLGVYLSEKNKGVFKDAFITFTSEPRMQYLQGTATQRFQQVTGAVGYDTNIQKAMALILNTAVREGLTQEDLPDNLLIISDMEFNDTNIKGKTNLEAFADKFKEAGYEMPGIVFRNVNGRKGNVPSSATKKGVALVSGASPAIIKSVLGGKDMTPEGVMMEVLLSERYASIV